MSACKHNNHRTDMVPYRLREGKKDKVSVDYGFNAAKLEWELCDRGLFIAFGDKHHRRKRPHSQPRKVAKKISSRNEE